MEQDAVVLEVPNEMNEIRGETRVIEVYEIQENPSPSRTKCLCVLLTWVIVLVSLIILKTLY